MPENLRHFWEAYSVANGGADESRFYEAFAFGDNESLADELVQLVLQGTKRATAGSNWVFEHQGKPIPKPGDLSIVTNWAGEPLCIIETLSVEIAPFNRVRTEFAAAECEGDKSLAFWHAAHSQYFARECAGIGRPFHEGMPVVCEYFKVVYQPSAA